MKINISQNALDAWYAARPLMRELMMNNQEITSHSPVFLAWSKMDAYLGMWFPPQPPSVRTYAADEDTFLP